MDVKLKPIKIVQNLDGRIYSLLLSLGELRSVCKIQHLTFGAGKVVVSTPSAGIAKVKKA